MCDILSQKYQSLSETNKRKTQYFFPNIKNTTFLLITTKKEKQRKPQFIATYASIKTTGAIQESHSIEINVKIGVKSQRISQ